MASRGRRRAKRTEVTLDGFEPAEAPAQRARERSVIDDFLLTGEECMSMTLPTEAEAAETARCLHSLRRDYMRQRGDGEPRVGTSKKGLSVYIFREGGAHDR